MTLQLSPYTPADAADATALWNSIVAEGIAFPQEEQLTTARGDTFFQSQSRTILAKNEAGRLVGLYILHPNNVGRCGHLCNASYAVQADCRGQGIGRALVTHCLEEAGRLGFRILQFNAVVATNASARHLYESLGFLPLGVIPGGFRMPDGRYVDIVPHYKVLERSNP